MSQRSEDPVSNVRSCIEGREQQESEHREDLRLQIRCFPFKAFIKTLNRIELELDKGCFALGISKNNFFQEVINIGISTLLGFAFDLNFDFDLLPLPLPLPLTLY